MAGRISYIEAVEANPAVVFVGAASGGVWKSTNAGTTWEQILAYLAVEPRASIVPDWLILPEVGQREIKGLFDTSAAAGATLKVALTRGAYYVGCNTNPAGGDRAFPAILLKVLEG